MAKTISEMVRTTAPRSHLDRVVAIGFVTALIVPGIAFIAGARPPDIENSTPATMPPLSAGALTETSTYAAIDRYIADNLPARDRAVSAYADLDYGLLGGSSNPQVIPGVEDWLFFTGELRPRCATDAAGLLAQIDSVAKRADMAGLDLRFVIAPDKHAIHPERLQPSSPIPPACTDAARDALRAGMATRPGSTVDLWAPILMARDAAAEPLYFTQDSHWTPTGALAGIEALVESVAPGVWDPAEITIDGTSTYPMELARLMGTPRDAVVPAYVMRPTMDVARTEVPTDVDLRGAPDIADYTVTGDGPLVPGTTLIAYDSFFNISRPRIVPWFERTIWVHISDLRDQPGLMADLPPIDRVIVERVERHAYELDLVKTLAPVLDRD